jgi:hypothetical protein
MAEFNLKKLYKELDDHCVKNYIYSVDSETEKKNAIIDNLLAAFVRSEISIIELKECINQVKIGKVINLDFFKKGGNLFPDFVAPRWERFARELFRQRSVGLGTPNAASGMGELMFLFLGKGLKKPKQGDLELNKELIELKSGEDIRVMSDVRGKDFREKSVAIAKKYKLAPNRANTKESILACEIEKDSHIEHWKNELAKLKLSEQKTFINEWLAILDQNNHPKEVSRIFKNNYFDHNQFKLSIIKIIFAFMVSQNKFNKFVIINGNKKGLIIPKNPQKFNRLIDQELVIPASDYFRVNQTNNVGWYITFR